MKAWLQSKLGFKKEKVAKVDEQPKEVTKEEMYEKHKVLGTDNSLLTELQQSQQNFMDELTGKTQK